MRGELPVCKRCCFCLPLRYGLISFGYLRLVISILLFIAVSIFFYGMLGLIFFSPTLAIILCFIIIVTLADIILNIIFIIGGHKKNPNLLRAYYVYSFVLWILTTLMGVTSTLYTLLIYMIGELEPASHIWVVLMNVTCLFAQTLIQVYMLLLVRSEIIKLRSNCQFRFVNNAANSECTMKCDEEVAGGEKGTEDSYERATYTPGTCEFIEHVTRNGESN